MSGAGTMRGLLVLGALALALPAAAQQGPHGSVQQGPHGSVQQGPHGGAQQGPHGGHAASGIPPTTALFRATVLLETPLLGTADRIYRLYIIDLGPGGATPRHMHPGDEIALVTEGSVTLELDGAPARTYAAGQTFHPPPMVAHVARNASATQPARLTVTSVTDAARPSTIVVPPTQ